MRSIFLFFNQILFFIQLNFANIAMFIHLNVDNKNLFFVIYHKLVNDRMITFYVIINATNIRVKSY